MKKVKVKMLKRNKWQIERELVLKKRKFYVLKNKELRIKTIQLYYNISIMYRMFILYIKMRKKK